ncbi:hypothetical protein [Janthinobacterium sp. 1_2014MBL_MicDiv]|uniref:hypothetical protein n=1 Tax=Janthinobacterium sp. 1_2014MBL_MicDiv TaxID=1644131 RepID=UPI0008F4B6FF|nr:hypothetical protein [Janthinobacterium sp. 1_2014MBL_MicDiv]APA67450.1 hypothetical protein YQ44_05875 [Janthinobacterium sp. 1_2014MBL_MicDiv]
MARAGRFFTGVAPGRRSSPDFLHAAPRHLAGADFSSVLMLMPAAAFLRPLHRVASQPGTLILVLFPAAIADRSILLHGGKVEPSKLNLLAAVGIKQALYIVTAA